MGVCHSAPEFDSGDGETTTTTTVASAVATTTTTTTTVTVTAATTDEVKVAANFADAAKTVSQLLALKKEYYESYFSHFTIAFVADSTVNASDILNTALNATMVAAFTAENPSNPLQVRFLGFQSPPSFTDENKTKTHSKIAASFVRRGSTLLPTPPTPEVVPMVATPQAAIPKEVDEEPDRMSTLATTPLHLYTGKAGRKQFKRDVITASLTTREEKEVKGFGELKERIWFESACRQEYARRHYPVIVYDNDSDTSIRFASECVRDLTVRLGSLAISEIPSANSESHCGLILGISYASLDSPSVKTMQNDISFPDLNSVARDELITLGTQADFRFDTIKFSDVCKLREILAATQNDIYNFTRQLCETNCT